MKFDNEFLGIISTTCKDLAVAFLIAAFVTPPLFPKTEAVEVIFTLTRNALNGTLLLIFSWQFAKMRK